MAAEGVEVRPAFLAEDRGNLLFRLARGAVVDHPEGILDAERRQDDARLLLRIYFLQQFESEDVPGLHPGLFRIGQFHAGERGDRLDGRRCRSVGRVGRLRRFGQMAAGAAGGRQGRQKE